jgi:hypothetical protein
MIELTTVFESIRVLPDPFASRALSILPIFVLQELGTPETLKQVDLVD